MAVSRQFPFPPPASGYHHPTPWDTPVDPVPLPELFRRQAEAHGNHALAHFLGRDFSYAALYDEARRFAGGLKANGIAPGERIGLFLPNIPTYIAAYYGAMMAGVVLANFSPLYSAAELAHQVEDSGTRMIVTLDSSALLPTALEVLDRSPLERLVVARLADLLPTGKSIALRLFGRKQVTPIPHRDKVDHWRDWLGDLAEPMVPKPDDLALLQYTGGTTGTPKGAMLTHGNLSSNAQQADLMDPFSREEPDVILGALPLFHVFANTCVLNRTMQRGGTIVMLPRFDAKQVIKAITQHKPTGFPGVPTMYQALLDHRDFDKCDWSSVRVCISGGAPMPAPLREQFEAATGARLVEGYGLTESSGVVSANPYEATRKPGTIGQVIAGTRVLLLDKEDPAKLAGEGEAGELAVRGPQIMAGYWNRRDADSSAFATVYGEKWLRTGDIATLDDDGFLAIVDRSKDMIAVGGFKVFPSQVEAVLLRNPAVKEALVIGVPDAYHGEMPQAYVVMNPEDEATAAELKDWLNSRVGKHERVKDVIIREDLPKTMIGKLDRKALRAEVLD
ncbi:AMP-binding protein [Porphyrobacter algicida]|uniref:AMP-binding protein n=1 Tax=Qipengyuania algicida TaxID=1836209 RepID=A0A845AHF1_9SPHN|nr:long-chain fatty acid--CoA ligase [Qipengyuania algicida]MXP27986.1 AMP-binding protein [Qipengyuania algicida]